MLAALSYAPEKGEFFRPLGGGIDFGERSPDTVRREIREEIREEITNLKYLGTIENLYIRDHLPQHELVLVYEADFVNQALYERSVIQGMEHNELFECEWVPISDFISGQATLFPDGLLDLLTAAS